LENLGVGGRIILKWIIKRMWRYGLQSCIHMAEDRNQWRALVKIIMNRRISWKLGNFLTNRATTAS
jgi:hypothetical protein